MTKLRLQKPLDKVWVWADTHFGHRNILTYSDRPFKNVENMYAQMLIDYNNLVGKDDLVFWLGDLGFYGWPKLKTLLEPFNGTKILIRGNHDKFKSDQLLEIFSAIHEQLRVVSEDGKVNFVLNHYPMLQWEGSNHGSIQLHGHTHQHNYFTNYYAKSELQNQIVSTWNPRRICVCVEAINYKPISLDEVVAISQKNIPIRAM